MPLPYDVIRMECVECVWAWGEFPLGEFGQLWTGVRGCYIRDY